MIEAIPVTGLAATPKSSYRSRFPVQLIPPSHTPPVVDDGAGLGLAERAAGRRGPEVLRQVDEPGGAVGVAVGWVVPVVVGRPVVDEVDLPGCAGLEPREDRRVRPGLVDRDRLGPGGA